METVEVSLEQCVTDAAYGPAKAAELEMLAKRVRAIAVAANGKPASKRPAKKKEKEGAV